MLCEEYDDRLSNFRINCWAVEGQYCFNFFIYLFFYSFVCLFLNSAIPIWKATSVNRKFNAEGTISIFKVNYIYIQYIYIHYYPWVLYIYTYVWTPAHVWRGWWLLATRKNLHGLPVESGARVWLINALLLEQLLCCCC